MKRIIVSLLALCIAFSALLFKIAVISTLCAIPVYFLGGMLVASHPGLFPAALLELSFLEVAGSILVARLVMFAVFMGSRPKARPRVYHAECPGIVDHD